MLTKLTVEQVAQYWQGISETLEDLPRVTVLEELMSMRMQCWIEVMGGEVKFIVLTRIEPDVLEGVDRLLIYHLYSYGKGLGSLPWRSGLETLFKYAAAKNCMEIIAWTDNKHLVQFLTKLGGYVRQVVYLPIGGFKG